MRRAFPNCIHDGDAIVNVGCDKRLLHNLSGTRSKPILLRHLIYQGQCIILPIFEANHIPTTTCGWADRYKTS